MSDPAKYRTKEEVRKVRQESDPIDYVRDLIFENKIADEASLKETDLAVKAMVTKAAEFAQQSPEPEPEELYTDVLVEA